VRIIVGSCVTTDPVTVPGFGYADALVGTSARRSAAGRARRRRGVRGVLVRLMGTLPFWISNNDRHCERNVESNPLRVNGSRNGGTTSGSGGNCRKVEPS
jgi:hypothetical protein